MSDTTPELGRSNPGEVEKREKLRVKETGGPPLRQHPDDAWELIRRQRSLPEPEETDEPPEPAAVLAESRDWMRRVREAFVDQNPTAVVRLLNAGELIEARAEEALGIRNEGGGP